MLRTNREVLTLTHLRDILVAPQTKQDLKTRNALILFVLGVVFLLLYVADLDFTNWQRSTTSTLVGAAILAVVQILLASTDPLQYGSGKYSSFFQSQFPSVHIQARLGVSPVEARQRWFSVFNQWEQSTHPNHRFHVTALTRGFECRAIYYLQWLSIRVGALAFLAVGILASLTWLADVRLPEYYSLTNSALVAPRVIYPLAMFALYLYLSRTNQPDPDNPSGVWRKWKEINDILKSWWDSNYGSQD